MTHYHFIGIGGIGMSALARILLERKEKVSGSDLKGSPITRALEREGAKIFLGHDRVAMGRPDVVVYSTDIPPENDEYLYAKEEKIPLLHRSELLGRLMKGSAPLLVAGTHGKTTTSSLLVHLLVAAGLDPTFAVGGIIKNLHANGRAGGGLYFIAEADESDGSFLNYPSFGAIITNLERDHMNFWENEKALENAFSRFAWQVGSPDHLFWCCDDPRLVSLKLPGNRFGFSDSAHLKIDNFRQEGWKTYFDVSFEGKHYNEIELPLVGAHNVLNATAAFGLALKLDISEELIRKAFLDFQGIGRRLELKGEVNQARIYDDYAHHPTEIFASLRALKMATHPTRMIAVFQPHRYSRVRDCMADFPEAFEHADLVLITDIYGAGEQPIQGITGKALCSKIEAEVPCQYASREELVEILSALIQPGDVILTMGAGDITQVGPGLLNHGK